MCWPPHSDYLRDGHPRLHFEILLILIYAFNLKFPGNTLLSDDNTSFSKASGYSTPDSLFTMEP